MHSHDRMWGRGGLHVRGCEWSYVEGKAASCEWRALA